MSKNRDGYVHVVTPIGGQLGNFFLPFCQTMSGLVHILLLLSNILQPRLSCFPNPRQIIPQLNCPFRELFHLLFLLGDSLENPIE